MAEPELHHYKANCHCGAVKVQFAVEEAIEQRTLISCNCMGFINYSDSRLTHIYLTGSICTKNGYINVYAPNELVEIQDDRQMLKVSE